MVVDGRETSGEGSWAGMGQTEVRAMAEIMTDTSPAGMAAAIAEALEACFLLPATGLSHPRGANQVLSDRPRLRGAMPRG
jgi:hypothetical protein